MISIPDELKSTLSLLPGPKLRRGKYGKHVTFIPSRKNGGNVACESLLEAAFCLELERLPIITAYHSQPFTLALTSSRQRYTPDFVARLRDKRLIVYEIKTNSALSDAPTRDRLSYFKTLFAQCGYPLECIGDSQFWHPVRTPNLHFLYHKSFGSDRKSASHVSSLLYGSPHGKLTVQELLDNHAPPQDIAFAVFYGLVVADLQRPFGIQTQLQCRGDNA
ncbi:hypothetical protein DM872_14330 [Pseudomonas taiwanensis]|uniref:TnsA endonuclease N-terminal domain-containing protein n=1 Tax=Pseudomonas taiwanensis TaxID=470150 RepID=UPI0015BB97A2|nr:TnsA endonuclease N-terminal domain-containing protein [Pseudomonas taiwanensis]NWL78029.1 hypothetical protein [Pseudomonas taiwanensis]